MSSCLCGNLCVKHCMECVDCMKFKPCFGYWCSGKAYGNMPFCRPCIKKNLGKCSPELLTESLAEADEAQDEIDWLLRAEKCLVEALPSDLTRVIRYYL